MVCDLIGWQRPLKRPTKIISSLFYGDQNRLALLGLLAKSKRFKSIKAFGFVDDYQLEQEKQFSAISYRIDRKRL